MRLFTSCRLSRKTWSLLFVPSILSVAIAEKTAADYYVHSLPGAPDGPLLKMHAGHIEITPEHNGNLFFWHFQNQHIANRQRTVIWLNGGPGCSSEDGALMEIGPYRLKDDSHLEYNVGSWNEFANVMFVDNPVGTGFSYVDTDSYLHDLPDMANQFVTFLEKWFAIFPEYEQDDLYFAGESYAGQHIPYISRAILDRNKGDVRHTWNLKGLLIGNGWISPVEQYLSYVPFAYEAGLVEKGSKIAQSIEDQQSQCTKALNDAIWKDRVSVPACETILQQILTLTETKGPDGSSQCVNMYDVRLKDSVPSCGMNWPPDLQYVTPYLRRNDVLQALNIDDSHAPGWTECSGAVSGAFKTRNSKPSVELLPGIIAEVPILLFSGAQDLICNHLGTEDLINNMEWNGGKGFELSPGNWAPRMDWTFEGESAGIYQEARNLTYVLFYNSSHMVPFDYARRSRDMLDRFMNVDIASIGGAPSDSRIDGEKGLETSVGGHPNSTVAEQEEKKKVDAASRHAYYRSGEIALVVVCIAASIWGYYVWKERRGRVGYSGLFGGSRNGSNANRILSMENFHLRPRRDVEAGDFDEGQLDDLHIATPEDLEKDRYSVGSVSDDESPRKGPGGTSRHPSEKGIRKL